MDVERLADEMEPVSVGGDGSKSDLAALEALVVDNHDLAELEQLLAGFNLFEVLGNVRREERHSDFLAFLLNPTQPHGLDDAVLRSFVQAAIAAEPEEPTSLRRIDVALFDLSEARVEREWNNIDILVTSEAEQFVLLVENKVFTDEHSDQLRRYLDVVRARFPGWAVLPVFLTRDGHAASHPAYHSVSYGDVHEVLAGLLERQRSSFPPDIEVTVRHYVEMLERHIMDDTPIAELARKIYARHGRALDIVFEHRPDAQELMRQEIVAAIEESDDLRLVYSSKTFIQFVPVQWDGIPSLRSGSDGSWAKQTDLLRFEFKQQGGLSLHLLVGPGEHVLRTQLHNESGRPQHKSIFKNRNTKLYCTWTQLWRLAIVSKKEDSELSIDKKKAKFHQAWDTFRKGPLPAIVDVFVKLLGGGSESTPDADPQTTETLGSEQDGP